MKMMELNKFVQDVHQNAVEHGWWEEERSFGEIVALCHSELSEALEEFRAKRPMVWFACTECDQEQPCNPKDEYDCQNFGEEAMCKHRSKKPEGIAVELADCAIRIMDWFGKEGLDFEEEFRKSHKDGIVDMDGSFGEIITELHSTLTYAYETDNVRAFYMALCVTGIMKWAEKNDVDMEGILRVKHEYNKSRPYRHGGKAL